jgi:hypothetical protein
MTTSARRRGSGEMRGTGTTEEGDGLTDVSLRIADASKWDIGYCLCRELALVVEKRE